MAELTSAVAEPVVSPVPIEADMASLTLAEGSTSLSVASPSTASFSSASSTSVSSTDAVGDSAADPAAAAADSAAILAQLDDLSDYNADADPLPYHDENKQCNVAGYWSRLDDYQRGKLERMLALVAEKQASMPDLRRYLATARESLPMCMLRFLRARKFKVTKAWELLEQDVAWRAAQGTDVVLRKTPLEVLGVENMTVINEYLPWWHQGYDKQGRPVFFKRFGNCRMAELLKVTTTEQMLAYHVWQQEFAMRELGRQTKRLGRTIETVVAVIDASGWTLSLATRTAYGYLKGMADLDSAHYPERLGQIVVVNSPSMLAFAWRLIRSWLDDRTKEKIQIVRGPTEYLPILRNIMDDDQIPTEFGGSGVSHAPVAVQVVDPNSVKEEETVDPTMAAEAAQFAESTGGSAAVLSADAAPSPTSTDAPKKKGWFGLW